MCRKEADVKPELAGVADRLRRYVMELPPLIRTAKPASDRPAPLAAPESRLRPFPPSVGARTLNGFLQLTNIVACNFPSLGKLCHHRLGPSSEETQNFIEEAISCHGALGTTWSRNRIAELSSRQTPQTAFEEITGVGDRFRGQTIRTGPPDNKRSFGVHHGAPRCVLLAKMRWFLYASSDKRAEVWRCT